MMNALFGTALLGRWHNAFLAGFAVWVGAHTCGFSGLHPSLLFACLVTVLVTAGGNASNDIADLRVDREAKPHRPLASGVVPLWAGWIFVSLSFLLGMVAAFRLGVPHRSIAAGVIALLLFYNFLLKHVPLAGNVLVALMSGLPFLYGGILSKEWRWALIPFCFAALTHLAREILKSVEDKDGDMKNGIRTIAAYVPDKVLRTISTSFLFLVCVLAVLPFAWSWYNRTYLIVLSAGVYFPTGFLFVILWKNNWKRQFGLIHQLLKIQMLGGTIAVLLGR